MANQKLAGAQCYDQDLAPRHVRRNTLKSITFILLLAPLLAWAADYHHVHMRAEDTLATATWYADNMGGELTTLGDFDAVKFGDILLLFFDADRAGADGSAFPGKLDNSAGSAFDHLGFSFINLEEQMPQFVEAGAKVIKPAEDVLGLFSYAFIEDPWGQKIEVMQDPELLGFHHVHIMAVDADKAIEWYGKIFGGSIVKFKDLPPLPAIQYNNFWLIVSATDVESRPNMFTMLDHLGWLVTDLENEMEKVRATDARILKEAGPLFSWQQWIPFYRGPYLGFVESPDGVTIEVLQLD